MQRFVLPFTLVAALVAGVTMAQFESAPAERNVQTATALGLCIKMGIGCSR